MTNQMGGGVQNGKTKVKVNVDTKKYMFPNFTIFIFHDSGFVVDQLSKSKPSVFSDGFILIGCC